MNKTIFTITSVMLYFACSFATPQDSLLQTELKALQGKVDSLEVKIERLMIQKSDNTPLAKGEYVNWGNGFTLSGELLQMTLEMGYTFRLLNGRLRFGIMAGHSLIDDIEKQSSSWPSSIDWKNKAQHYAHLKLMVASPVLFNFMSISASVAPMYVLDSPFLDEANGDVYGFSILRSSAEVEFWVSRSFSIPMGVSHTRYKLTIDSPEIGQYNDPIRWYDNSFQAGLRYYASPRKHKTRNR